MYWWKSNSARCWRSVYRDSCLVCRMHQNYTGCKAGIKIHMVCFCLYLYRYSSLRLRMYWWRSNSARCWCSVYKIMFRVYFACYMTVTIFTRYTFVYISIATRGWVWLCTGEEIIVRDTGFLFTETQTSHVESIRISKDETSNKIQLICLCIYFYSYFPLSSIIYYWRRKNAIYCCLFTETHVSHVECIRISHDAKSITRFAWYVLFIFLNLYPLSFNM
jgi:hypothetical protein